jgi:hypothetical protein
MIPTGLGTISFVRIAVSTEGDGFGCNIKVVAVLAGDLSSIRLPRLPSWKLDRDMQGNRSSELKSAASSSFIICSLAQVKTSSSESADDKCSSCPIKNKSLGQQLHGG